MNWLAFIQALNKILSSGGKKAENLYRTLMLVAIVLIYIDIKEVKNNQTENKRTMVRKLDTIKKDFAQHVTLGEGKLETINTNFKNVDDRFKRYDERLSYQEQQLTAVRDNVFTMMRGRYRMQ